MNEFTRSKNSVPISGALSALSLERHWTFVASPIPRWRRRLVVESLLRRGIRAPQFYCIKEIDSRPQWVLYFVYAPDGSLNDAHRFTLARLRDQNFNIFVVVSTGQVGQVPLELFRYADGIYWKALPGYDFSAYKLGLDLLVKKSEGASVLVLNDSVFGPLNDLREFINNPSWNLTGFTATGKIENHIQSYAFVIKHLTRDTMRNLQTVVFPFFACGSRDDVVNCQETRLARIAAQSMSVGAHWYMRAGDPTQVAPFELIDAGYPFIKKSLLETRSSFNDKERVRSLLTGLQGAEANSFFNVTSKG